MKILTTVNEASLDKAPEVKVNDTTSELEDARTMCTENNTRLEIESDNILYVGPSTVADSKSDSELSNLSTKYHASKQYKCVQYYDSIPYLSP